MGDRKICICGWQLWCRMKINQRIYWCKLSVRKKSDRKFFHWCIKVYVSFVSGINNKYWTIFWRKKTITKIIIILFFKTHYNYCSWLKFYYSFCFFLSDYWHNFNLMEDSRCVSLPQSKKKKTFGNLNGSSSGGNQAVPHISCVYLIYFAFHVFIFGVCCLNWRALGEPDVDLCWSRPAGSCFILFCVKLQLKLQSFRIASWQQHLLPHVGGGRFVMLSCCRKFHSADLTWS